MPPSSVSDPVSLAGVAGGPVAGQATVGASIQETSLRDCAAWRTLEEFLDAELEPGPQKDGHNETREIHGIVGILRENKARAKAGELARKRGVSVRIAPVDTRRRGSGCAPWLESGVGSAIAGCSCCCKGEPLGKNRSAGSTARKA